MPHNLLWATDIFGSLFKLDLKTQEWSETSHATQATHKETFKRVAATSSCAWAITGEQKVCVCVFDTDLPIKLQVHCYENERWSILHGWSKKSRLLTDRWHYSSKDGKKKEDKDSIVVPSEAWVWNCDWYIDESIECDAEGWQYAVDFPATYYKQPGHLMFVRRRRWTRQREFLNFNTWITVHGNTNTDPFQDIAVGGYELPAQVDGFLAVWAITFSGKVYFRHGVSRLCPEGDEWLEVETTEDINLVQISVGTTGLVWGCTWDGSAAVRRGVSHANPVGTGWEIINNPLNDPLHSIAVGTKSVWSLSKSGKIYFWIGLINKVCGSTDSLTSSTSSNSSKTSSKTSLTSSTPSHASSWIEMVGAFSTIDVGPNDQVWVVEQESKQLHFRTNVTEEELSGHTWKPLHFIGNRVPEYIFSISSGGCDVDSSYFERNMVGGLVAAASSLSLASNPEDNQWRNDILMSLCERNNQVNECRKLNRMFSEGETKCEKWNKRGECKFLLDKVYDTWCGCHLKLQTTHVEGFNDQDPVLYIYYMNKKRSYKELALPIKKVACVHRLKYLSKQHCLGIEMCENDSKLNKVILSMESDVMVNDWLDTLNNDIIENQSGDYTTLWATNYMGDLYKCNISNYLAVSAYKWTYVAGHMCFVVSGRDGITWGIGFDGKPYVYVGGNGKKSHDQQNTEDHYIYENQRWNPVEGYADRLLISDRWNWSDESGLHELSKQTYPLPSASKWIADWSIDYQKSADEDGWQYAVDFPRTYHKYRGLNDYVRRRRWKRSCIVHWSGPWMEVKTDVKLCDISIDMSDTSLKDDGSDNTCCVWAVSYKGDVMVRNDVTPDCPQGTSWTNIPTETPVISLSTGHKSRVWAVRKDGSCYLRSGFQEDKKIGNDWFHVLKEEVFMNRVFAGHNFILGLDKMGTLCMRSSVTNIYPEGTEWEPVMYDVSDVSVNKNDQVYIVQKNEIKLWMNVLSGKFDTCQLITLLQVGWTGISCRTIFQSNQNSDSIETPDGYDVISTENDDNTTTVDSEDVISAASEQINPYSVDIYSFYSGNELDVESMLFDSSDSRVSIDC